MSGSKATGVMLIALGGPSSLEEVGPFLSAILGRPSPPPLVNAVTERYKVIGGKSPLPDIVQAQAEALGKELSGQVMPLAGFLYSRPNIMETLLKFAEMRVQRLLALPMSPFYTSITTGAYQKALEETANDLKSLPVVFIESWHDHPSFIHAWTEKVARSLAIFPAERQNRVQVIFSAHSIPKKYIENGEPYQRQIEETARKIANSLGLEFWRVAYQSKGIRTSESWLEPEVERALDEIEASGFRDVLQVPLGFTCDHLETLYDIDILHREYAKEKGLNFQRAESLNLSPLFINALAHIVRQYL